MGADPVAPFCDWCGYIFQGMGETYGKKPRDPNYSLTLSEQWPPPCKAATFLLCCDCFVPVRDLIDHVAGLLALQDEEGSVCTNCGKRYDKIRDEKCKSCDAPGPMPSNAALARAAVLFSKLMAHGSEHPWPHT